ncbi:MAG: hypothetical protein AAF645_14970, partial [Myxococcota bacterium]
EFDILERRLRELADLPANPLDDGMATICDALSIAVRYTFTPVRLGPISEGGVPPDTCDE